MADSVKNHSDAIDFTHYGMGNNMKKILIAIDSFKGSLSSMEAGNAAAAGIRRVFPDADIAVRPLADGGEGTVDALASGCNGTIHTISVTGPLNKKVSCRYCIIPHNRTAVIEMSGAAGITLLSEKERNPLMTTTYGVGEVINDAIKNNCRNFIIGIGGSATNDGGIGMLQALGFGFLDKDGKQISPGAHGLSKLDHITDNNIIKELKECSFKIACDVTNPLCGENGCSAVFGPQKGADKDMIACMDSWLRSYSSIAKKKYPLADPEYPGSGAAGGMGFAFHTFLNASLESGVKIILNETCLSDYIKEADICITGEGRLDGQTVMGKAPIGVARIAKQYNKPVIAFSGCVSRDAVKCNQAGIDAYFPILQNVVTLSEAMVPENATMNMAATAEQVFRLLKLQLPLV